jgi:hypothetical protein
MRDSIQLIGAAKARIDNGFSRIGKNLKAEDPADRALMLLASRCVALANAALLLGMNNHANEGLPLLRSLLEFSAHMRWVALDRSAERGREFLEKYSDACWEDFWGSARIEERRDVLCFPRLLEESASYSCADHVFGNSLGLPWGHVFSDHARKGVSAESFLSVISILMGHVVKSLDLRWPGNFSADEWDNERMRS